MTFNLSYRKKQAIISVLLISALIISSVFAFLTAKDDMENVFVFGDVDVELWERVDGTLYGPKDGEVPALTVNGINTTSKEPYIVNTGSVPAVVYMSVGVPKATTVFYNALGIAENGGSPYEKELFKLNGINSDEWKLIGTDSDADKNYYLYQYQTIVAASGQTEPLFTSITSENAASTDKIVYAVGSSDFTAGTEVETGIDGMALNKYYKCNTQMDYEQFRTITFSYRPSEENDALDFANNPNSLTKLSDAYSSVKIVDAYEVYDKITSMSDDDFDTYMLKVADDVIEHSDAFKAINTLNSKEIQDIADYLAIEGTCTSADALIAGIRANPDRILLAETAIACALLRGKITDENLMKALQIINLQNTSYSFETWETLLCLSGNDSMAAVITDKTGTQQQMIALLGGPSGTFKNELLLFPQNTFISSFSGNVNKTCLLNYEIDSISFDKSSSENTFKMPINAYAIQDKYVNVDYNAEIYKDEESYLERYNDHYKVLDEQIYFGATYTTPRTRITEGETEVGEGQYDYFEYLNLTAFSVCTAHSFSDIDLNHVKFNCRFAMNDTEIFIGENGNTTPQVKTVGSNFQYSYVTHNGYEIPIIINSIGSNTVSINGEDLLFADGVYIIYGGVYPDPYALLEIYGSAYKQELDDIFDYTSNGGKNTRTYPDKFILKGSNAPIIAYSNIYSESDTLIADIFSLGFGLLADGYVFTTFAIDADTIIEDERASSADMVAYIKVGTRYHGYFGEPLYQVSNKSSTQASDYVIASIPMANFKDVSGTFTTTLDETEYNIDDFTYYESGNLAYYHLSYTDSITNSKGETTRSGNLYIVNSIGNNNITVADALHSVSLSDGIYLIYDDTQQDGFNFKCPNGKTLVVGHKVVNTSDPFYVFEKCFNTGYDAVSPIRFKEGT